MQVGGATVNRGCGNRNKGTGLRMGNRFGSDPGSIQEIRTGPDSIKRV